VSCRKPNLYFLLSWYSEKIAAGIVRRQAVTRQDALFLLMKLAVSEIDKIKRKKIEVEAPPQQVVQDAVMEELSLLLGALLKQKKTTNV
jgi:hypothetical protein